MADTAKSALRDTGIDILGEVAWGTHVCLFYEEQSDLVDVAVPRVSGCAAEGLKR